MTDDDVWFEAKTHGYGAGMPVSWQGWALIGGFLVLLTAAGIALVPRHPWLFVALSLIATVPLIVLSARHTRGGWRWRWGGRA